MCPSDVCAVIQKIEVIWSATLAQSSLNFDIGDQSVEINSMQYFIYYALTQWDKLYFLQNSLIVQLSLILFLG